MTIDQIKLDDIETEWRLRVRESVVKATKDLKYPSCSFFTMKPLNEFDYEKCACMFGYIETKGHYPIECWTIFIYPGIMYRYKGETFETVEKALEKAKYGTIRNLFEKMKTDCEKDYPFTFLAFTFCMFSLVTLIFIIMGL